MLRVVTVLIILSCCPQAQASKQYGCPPEQLQADFNPFQQADPNLPYSQGLLWRLEKDQQLRGHIFGTIHLTNPSVTRLPPQVRLIFAQSQSLLMETVLDSEAHRTYRTGIYYDDTQTFNLQDALKPALYQKARDLLSAYGLPEARQLALKPWAIFSMLGRPRPGNSPVQDEVLLQLARQSNKPVYGMETMRDLIATLDSIPLDDQITIMVDTLCQHARLMASVRQLLEIYTARDLAAMQALNDQAHADEAVFQRFMQIMLGQRNDRMQESILQHLESGKVFIAVGALHLPGEEGLLSRLARAGFTISPVF